MADAKTIHRYFQIQAEIKDLVSARGLDTRAVAKAPLGYIVINKAGQALVAYQMVPDGTVVVVSEKFKHVVTLDVLLWEIDLATVDMAEAVQ